jgi:mono/diheme cytochrome c family protein
MKYVCLVVFLLTAVAAVFADRAVPTGSRTAAELFSKNCASCHGRDGRAKTLKAKFNHARNLSDPEWQERVSDERIFNAIMNGKGKMPPYGKKLSEPEINALVSYVRGLRK